MLVSWQIRNSGIGGCRSTESAYYEAREEDEPPEQFKICTGRLEEEARDGNLNQGDRKQRSLQFGLELARGTIVLMVVFPHAFLSA